MALTTPNRPSMTPVSYTHRRDGPRWRSAVRSHPRTRGVLWDAVAAECVVGNCLPLEDQTATPETSMALSRAAGRAAVQ
jgi:hypothetical protein